jgi:hypothetical protein
MPAAAHHKKDRFARAADAVAAAERKIQKQIDRNEKAHPKKKGKGAMQAGAIRSLPFPNSIKSNLAWNPISSSSQCTMLRIITARKSSRTRSR